MIAKRTTAPSPDWLLGEPPLSEVICDTLVHAILHRDGLSLQDLQRAIALGRRRLAAGRPATSDAA
jgi:hypothetical protein